MTELDVIVDLQFGSTGKGLIAGYLAEREGYDTVITANMPNAGHTYINSTGRKWVHKVLPNGIVSPNLERVLIAPGAVFSLDRLSTELSDSYDLLRDVTVYIHQDAVVLQEEHTTAEIKGLNSIASTMQGSAEAVIEKMRRNPYLDSRADKLLRELTHINGVQIEVVSQYQWVNLLYMSKKALLEGAQGYSLGINAGFWPYCTSRDCTPARFLADCQIPLGMLRRVIGTARLHPIRVGNTNGGFSGPCYNDQYEISWSDLGVEPERTTVTGRVRRVFTFSKQQIKEAIQVCQPNEVFLNFCNYDPANVDRTVNTINNFLCTYVPGGASVRYIGWGPTRTDVQERHPLNPCDYSETEVDKGWV